MVCQEVPATVTFLKLMWSLRLQDYMPQFRDQTAMGALMPPRDSCGMALLHPNLGSRVCVISLVKKARSESEIWQA
jgi:hypothetical protein